MTKIKANKTKTVAIDFEKTNKANLKNYFRFQNWAPKSHESEKDLWYISFLIFATIRWILNPTLLQCKM